MEKGRLGVMIDCSRNAVMRPDQLKAYMDVLAKMGYNMVMLYTEEVYEIEDEPHFGYMRGRFTKEELKDLVAHADAVGIEMIPCIQTLGHLGHIFRWRAYRGLQDVDDTLLVDHEPTYQLIDKMFKTVKEIFHTDKVHIGMDEAYDIGRGRYMDKHGYVDHFELLKRHLGRVAEMAKGYGLTPIMWDDMFFALVDGQYYHYHDSDVITKEIADLVPENVELVYWDYFTGKKEWCDNMMKAHKAFRNPIWFAGGGLTWTGHTPHNFLAQLNLKNAAQSCAENGVKNFVVTCWGDDGGETSRWSILPTLYAAARYYQGEYDEDVIKAGFEKMFGMAFDDYMKLDYPSTKTAELCRHYDSVDRLVLYSDPFKGKYDPLFDTPEAAQWQKNMADHAKELHELAQKADRPVLFEQAAALCDLTAAKMTLGVRLRKAYQSGDKAALASIRAQIPGIIDLYEAFYQVLRKQWYAENKPNGFEVQDLRLGGMMRRLQNCFEQLGLYLDGTLTELPELAETLLPCELPSEDIKEWRFGAIYTVTRLSQTYF